MITAERLARYKKLALASVAARAKNPKAPGITCVEVTPHDLLDLVHAFEEVERLAAAQAKTEEP